MLFDTHAHLDHPKFDGDRDEVLARARAAGVSRLMLIGTNLTTSRRALALAESDPCIWAAVGVHPHDAAQWNESVRREMATLAQHPKVRAIGEIGLDYHYDFASRDDQFRAFRAQIHLARELHLPIIVHNREADDDILKVLAAEVATEVGGIMHCWSSGWETAERAMALNFMLGIGGSVTFPKNVEVRQVAEQVPANDFVLETDCPYLAPVPHRGKRNEPSLVRVVAEYVAELRGVSLSDLATITTRNAFRKLRITDTEASPS